MDVDKKRIDFINSKKSTVKDADIDRFFNNKNLQISATDDLVAAYDNASFIVVATPTNYDPETNKFDTSLVDMVCRDALRINENALVVIGDSDTRIVKGLLALILALYNGLTPEEVLAVNAYDEFEKLGLISHLSASRGNGVKAMVETIQTMAKQKAL